MHLESELDVLEDAPVREEREVLEYRRRRALVRREADERDAVQQDVASGRCLVAADHPQRRRLAAARRSKEDDVLAVVDVQVEVVDGEGTAGKDLCQSDEIEPGPLPRAGGGGRCRPLRLRDFSACHPQLCRQEVVDGLDEVDRLAWVGVP
jgi:hypothetical protein